MESIDDSATSSLVTGVASKRIDLRRQAEEALNDALWEAGKNDNIPNESRENWAECLAGINLEKRLSSLADNPENRPFESSPKFRKFGFGF